MISGVVKSLNKSPLRSLNIVTFTFWYESVCFKISLACLEIEVFSYGSREIHPPFPTTIEGMSKLSQLFELCGYQSVVLARTPPPPIYLS